MIIHQLAGGFSVAGQITPDDLPALAAKGYRSLICNRPDGEAFGQPGFAEVEAAARAVGIEARYVPVSGLPGGADVHAFGAALKAMPGPVLAYCRSGGRSSALFNALQQPSLS